MKGSSVIKVIKTSDRTGLIVAVVVAQVVERLLPKPEICSSKPVIGNLSTNCIIEKTKIKKRGREWPTFKNQEYLANVRCYF